MARPANTGSEGASSTSSSDDGVSRRAALVLAVSEYSDSMLRQLRSPAGDAADFGEVLGSPDLGGFDVTTVLDGRAHQIRLAVEEFLAACGRTTWRWCTCRATASSMRAAGSTSPRPTP